MVGSAGTSIVLDRLARPYDPSKVVGALLGLPPRLARQLVGAILATSEEAETLLEAMPRVLRSLAIATTDRPERCYGELRGPVLWSETMSARSASAGDPGLFVCATTTKAYDTVENRVLKAALDTIRRAGAHADHGPEAQHDAMVRRARQNGHRASHLLEHRALSDVPVTRVSGRALTRTRSGNKRSTYQPAVDVLRRAADPVGAEQLAAHADAATRAQLALLAQAIEVVEERTGAPVKLRSSRGTIVSGSLSYDHLGGVLVDGRLITSPAEI